MDLTPELIDRLDARYSDYLLAIDSQDQAQIAAAVIGLDNIEMDLGARSNAHRGQLARRILQKAGRA